MEKNKHIEKLESFAKKYLKEQKLESPSVDFTKNIMDKILKEKTTSTLVSSGLISKKGWFIIFIFIAGILLIPIKETQKTIFKLPEVNFSFLESLNSLKLIGDFSVTTTTFYAVLFFALMILIQGYFLKDYFEKRITST